MDTSNTESEFSLLQNASIEKPRELFSFSHTVDGTSQRLSVLVQPWLEDGVSFLIKND